MAASAEEERGEFVYRISTASEWEELQKNGSTFGGELDKSSRCFHLSKLDQVGSLSSSFFFYILHRHPHPHQYINIYKRALQNWFIWLAISDGCLDLERCFEAWNSCHACHILISCYTGATNIAELLFEL